jgi:hypothetical protein
MRNLLRQGSDWLSDKLRHNASTIAWYRRGAASTSIAMQIGSSEFEVQDETGFSTRVETRDYLFNVDELLLDGVPVTPLVGDRIIEGDLTNGFAYDVCAVASEPHWQYADPFKRRMRVHTKFVGPFPPSPA